MRTLKLNHRIALLATFALLSLALVLYIPGWRSASASWPKNAKARASKPVQPQPSSVADGGSWSGLIPTKDVPVHISLLPDGRLLYWGRDKAVDGWDIGRRSNTYLADPLYLDNVGYTTTKLNNTTNLFCSGHSFLPDGRLLVSGGHTRVDSYPKKEGVGEKAINIFDYRTDTWTRLPAEMDKGRWYPFNITLGDGETLIMAGTFWDGVTFKSTSDGPQPATDDNKEPSLWGIQGYISTLRNDGTFPRVTTYPYISLAPDSRVFLAKPSAVAGAAGYESVLFDAYATNNAGEKGVFTNVASPQFRHVEGTSVMYAPGKVLLIGGTVADAGAGSTNVATVEAIDLNQASPTWSTLTPLAWARQFPTASLLPDGQVLVTGGTSCSGVNNLNCGPNNTYGGAVQTPEMWDPANPLVWKQMNPTTSGVPRVYHSVALLMPDARVFVGGGGLPVATGETTPGGVLCTGTNEATFPCKHAGHKDVEFFSPPYLFNADGSAATRPAITSAPGSIAYRQTFPVSIGNVSASDIKNVVLIRLPSVTHTYNQDQRRVVLPFTGAGDTLNVTAPDDGNACPPGPYMMFLISQNGRNTPSVARTVRVGDYAIGPNYPVGASQSFPPTSAQAMSGAINVTASAEVNWVAEVSPNASSWLSITAGGFGAGNGTVSFSVAPNQGSTPSTIVGSRSGVITVHPFGRDALGISFAVYQAGNFLDVPPGNGLYPFVSRIYARGITSGCGTGQFCLNDTITRGQAAVFVARVLNQSIPAPLTQRFSDVPLSNSFSPFIEYVARRGITLGCGAGTFCPDDPLSREAMVVWLLRAQGVDHPPMPTFQRFADVPLTNPTAPFIEEAYRRGITAGCGGGNFCPTAALTRGQMAVFLSQTFGL